MASLLPSVIVLLIEAIYIHHFFEATENVIMTSNNGNLSINFHPSQ